MRSGEGAGAGPGKFARFYAPLAATSLLLTATNPLLTAALARSTEPAVVLAGFSVAFALCGVLYSPLLVVQQVAATRILEGRDPAPVRRFALGVGAFFSLLAALVAFTDLGTWVFGSLIGVRGGVLAESLSAMAFLWPVPLLTGIRAAHQGRLVAGHTTRPIAAATGARTLALGGVAFVLAALTGGAWIGGVAFALGLLVETAIVGLSPTGDELPHFGDDTTPLVDAALEGGQELLRFTTPLMINGVLWWSTPLVINAVLARTPDPELALASFAIVEAVAWFVTAPVGQLQHASIAMVRNRSTFRRVRRWSLFLAVGMFVLLALLATPVVAGFVLDLAFRLDPTLLSAAATALPFAALYPLLYGHRQFYQGLFIRVGCPGTVGWGAALRVGSLVVAAVLLAELLGSYGAAFGVGLHAFGLVVEGGFLLVRSRVRVLPVLKSPAAAA